MKYAAVIEYVPDAATIEAIRPRHREYLNSLLAKNQLVCAGPFLDNFGALIVYEAESPEAVEHLIAADPFHTDGVFVRWTVRPWKCVFGNPQLLPPNG